MPRIKSAKKRMRQAKTHTVLNRTQRSKLRTAIKKVRAAVAGEAKQAYAEAVKMLDRAGRKRLFIRTRRRGRRAGSPSSSRVGTSSREHER